MSQSQLNGLSEAAAECQSASYERVAEAAAKENEAGESEEPPLSASEKVPQNPREKHCLPVLPFSQLAARLCLPVSLFQRLYSRPLRKDNVLGYSVKICPKVCILLPSAETRWVRDSFLSVSYPLLMGPLLRTTWGNALYLSHHPLFLPGTSLLLMGHGVPLHD